MKREKLWLVLAILSVFMITSAVISAEETKQKKKIVFVKDDDSEFFNGFAKFIGSEFEKNGWTKENSEYIVLSMEGKIEKAKENIEEIKKINPDVVYINGTYIEDRILPLKGTGIPVVVVCAVDYMVDGKPAFINDKGEATDNVTGCYLFTKDYEYNAFKMLNEIAPIKGKKAVVLVQGGILNKELLVSSLKKMKIPLKEYAEFKYFEDFQEALLKYNNDKEVGWIIADGPITRKDGKEWNRKDTFLWEHTNIKKPNIAFFQNNVENGALCGLAVDPMGYVMPSLDLAYQILQGKKPSEVTPVYPGKSYVLLNQKAAKQIGVTFPMSIVNSAWRIYTDYEGNFVGYKQ